MKKKTEVGQRFDILYHELVPQHIIMTDEEVKKLFEECEITPDQLPKILTTDPAAIAVEAKPGQFIKVIRNSRTAREAVAYRLVVESEK